VSVHREEVEHEISEGDRIQFTAPSKELKVANRELGTLERVSSENDLSVRLDSGREVRFNIREHAHLDHGYGVTSHNSQGQTAERVLIHVDTDKSELLVNNRFAYVSVSRAQHLEQQPAALKTEPVFSRGVRHSEEEQGHSLGIRTR
jgi:ATP-dependent exoDNAse (exonuclease V) alpha subunit